MIIAILEYPEDDQAYTYFVDVSKLDLTDRIQRGYFDNIMAARNHSSKTSKTSYDVCITYGDDIFESATVNPPCQIDDSVTLYIG